MSLAPYIWQVSNYVSWPLFFPHSVGNITP